MALEVLATAAIATAPESDETRTESVRSWVYAGEAAAGALTVPVDALDRRAASRSSRIYDVPSPSDTEVGCVRPAAQRKRAASSVEDATPSWKDLRRLIRRHPSFNEDRAGFLSRFGHGARSISDLDKASLLRIARHLGIVFNEPEQKRSRSQWFSSTSPGESVAQGPAGSAQPAHVHVADEDELSCKSDGWGPASTGSDSPAALEEAATPGCASLQLERRLAAMHKVAAAWDARSEGDEEPCCAGKCRKQLAEIAQLLALVVKKMDSFEKAHSKDFR